MKYFVCIKTVTITNCDYEIFTYGKKYECIKQQSYYYNVLDNKGFVNVLYQASIDDYFLTLSEYRKQKIKQLKNN